MYEKTFRTPFVHPLTGRAVVEELRLEAQQGPDEELVALLEGSGSPAGGPAGGPALPDDVGEGGEGGSNKPETPLSAQECSSSVQSSPSRVPSSVNDVRTAAEAKMASLHAELASMHDVMDSGSDDEEARAANNLNMACMRADMYAGRLGQARKGFTATGRSARKGAKPGWQQRMLRQVAKESARQQRRVRKQI